MARFHIFGDSYSTPGYCVEAKDSWWGLMATALSVDIIENYSWPGNNIDSISHIITSGPGFARDDYVVIGVPPIERFTIYDPESPAKQYHRFFKNFVEIDQPAITRHDGLKQVTTHQMGKEYVLMWDEHRSWQEAKVLRELFLLKQYIQGWTNNYLIVNLAEPFQEHTNWPPLESMQLKFRADPHSILFNDTYFSANKRRHLPVDYDTHGWHGHHGVDGNRHWFESVLKPRMETLKWL